LEAQLDGAGGKLAARVHLQLVERTLQVAGLR
jgi:hypothetical protein